MICFSCIKLLSYVAGEFPHRSYLNVTTGLLNKGKKEIVLLADFIRSWKKMYCIICLKAKTAHHHCLARGLKEKLEPQLQKPFDEGRLLVISPFEKNVKRVTEHTAEIRNRMMIELADTITVGYISVGGKLEKLLAVPDKLINQII